MRAIMETLFDAAYLVTVVTLGCIMVKSAQDRETKLFGWMVVILGCGDAFHLVPRAWALCTDGLAAHAAALGAGKFITSITMTIFYVILYHIGKRRYGLHIRALTGAVYAQAAARIGLCLFPQNAWLSANPPLSWSIWRNVPFALLGALVIVVFLRGARQAGDRAFCWMWLTHTPWPRGSPCSCGGKLPSGSFSHSMMSMRVSLPSALICSRIMPAYYGFHRNVQAPGAGAFRPAARAA